MVLDFNIELAKDYKSQSQIARILTEDWVLNNSYCPNCGNDVLNSYETNNPASDFYCKSCEADYELKSSRNHLNNRVVDGAYDTMIKKVVSSKNPHFFFLNYTPGYRVSNFFCIPKHFFIPGIIEKRKPLAATARRSGWVGCNILIRNLPPSGKIFLVKNEEVLDRRDVITQWKKTSFLHDESAKNRGWLVELISIIDRIPNKTFTLADVYGFEGVMKEKFPKNNFVKEKIRQQLQVLRDKNFIQFKGSGIYQKK